MAFDIELRSYGSGFDVELGPPVSTPLTVDVELVDGSTVIATWTDIAVTSSWVDLPLSVTSGEAATITNFDNLRVRIYHTGDAEQTQVSEVLGLRMLEVTPFAIVIRRSYGGGVSYSPGGQF